MLHRKLLRIELPAFMGKIELEEIDAHVGGGAYKNSLQGSHRAFELEERKRRLLNKDGSSNRE